ncbi:MAG TPA: hypothetical protein VF551_06355, partial [Chthoniobacterales bacterium]
MLATAQVQRTWTGGDGDWHDASMWTSNDVPETAAHFASVDSGAGAGTGWTVTNFSNITLGRLRVGPRDRVVHHILGVSNAEFAQAGVLDVAGTVQLYRESFGGRIDLLSDATFSGGGSIELGIPGNA